MQLQFPRITDARDYILTAVFLIIALALMAGRYQKGLANLRTASVTVFSYIEKPLANIRVYRQALKTNTELRKQNVLLLDKLSRLRGAEQRNKRLRKMLEFRRNSELSLYPVQVVGKELRPTNNSLTIDAGTEHGVEQGMPIISADGLIGKVIFSSSGYAQIMPFNHTLFRLSAKLQNTNTMGIISWDGESRKQLQLNYIPQTTAVDSGETVITSGSSNQFPADIPIGTVVDTIPQQGKETQKVIVRPFVNLFNIAEGFVVKFKPDTTINNLKQKYNNLLE